MLLHGKKPLVEVNILQTMYQVLRCDVFRDTFGGMSR